MQECLSIAAKVFTSPKTIARLSMLALLPLLTGCPDLSQVQQLDKLADAAKPSLAPIAADFKASCDRQNFYQFVPPGPLPEKPVSSCVNGDDLAKLGNNILKEQSLLIDYFDALGTLAATDASGFEKVAPALDTSFKTAGLDATQQAMAKASGTLASSIAKLVTEGYRKEKILEILKMSDGAVQTITTGLADQVASVNDLTPQDAGVSVKPNVTSYLGLLYNEDINLGTYYKIPLAKDHNSPAGLLLMNQYQTTLAVQSNRKDAAVAYRKLMLALGTAHAKLLNDASAGKFNKKSVEAIAKDLAQPISDISDSINTLQKDLR
jgi:hypothetical protein